jgi:hypothetical protein
MKNLALKAIGGLVLAGMISAPGWAAPDVPAEQNPSAIVPGTINYVEGQVSAGDQSLTP